MKSIYIAGPITGIEDYWEAFDKAERELTASGWVVLNPSVLPQGLKPEAYMPICLAMVSAADAMVMLPGWTNSQGARIEYSYAVNLGKRVFTDTGNVPRL